MIVELMPTDHDTMMDISAIATTASIEHEAYMTISGPYEAT